MYSDANDFAGAQVFAGLRFTFGAAGALTLTYRNGAAFNSTGLTTSSFNQGTVYTVEIVGNNKTSGTISYTYNGVSQSVAVQKFDLYINGTLIGDDLAEALLPSNTSITSTTLIGISSAANAANVFLDNVVVHNAVPASIGAPTVNAASAITSGGFTANWSSVSTATGYLLDVSTVNTFSSFVSGYNNLDVGNVVTANVTGLASSTPYFYRIRAYNTLGTASANSLTNTITTTAAGSAPSISAPPQNQTNNYNTTATFAVTASGTAPLSYQWRTNGVALADNSKFSGTLTNSLAVSNILFADTITNLTVVITNASGAVTSSIATLTVVDPFITSQPANATNLLGGAASFTVTASGSGTLNYQWLTNGVSVANGGRFSGATTASLTNSTIIAGDTNWNYTVVVGGAGLAVTSSPVALAVTNPPGIYRSKASGNWNDFAIWQVDFGVIGSVEDGLLRLLGVFNLEVSCEAYKLEAGEGLVGKIEYTRSSGAASKKCKATCFGQISEENSSDNT